MKPVLLAKNIPFYFLSKHVLTKNISKSDVENPNFTSFIYVKFHYYQNNKVSFERFHFRKKILLILYPRKYLKLYNWYILPYCIES